MPKRDEAYMLAQRKAIVLGAREVLVEKGIRATSLRDICKAAGVSIGALYVHFATKEEVVFSACVMGWEGPDAEEVAALPVVATWADYAAYMHWDVTCARDPFYLSKYGLALEFVAELTRMDEHPAGFSEIRGRYTDWIATSLSTLAQAGEITLPIGLDATVDLHAQLIDGAYFRLAMHQDAPVERVADDTVLALATVAGLDAPARPAKPSKRKATPGDPA
jgi:AcrR family transcriptional regulator